MDSQYFSALMIPDQQLAATYKFIETPQANVTTDIAVTAPTESAALVLPSFYLAAQEERTHIFRLYVGPKDDTILKSIEAPNAPENPVRLSKIIDFDSSGPSHGECSGYSKACTISLGTTASRLSSSPL